MTAPVILIETSPRRAADGVMETVRLAGGGGLYPYFYDSEHWRAGISKLPTLVTELSFDGGDFGAGGVPQAAEIEWGASTGADLAELSGYMWIDAPITVRIGPENADGVLPAIVLTGKVLSALPEGSMLKITLSDPASDLKKPLITATYGGTGGLDGPADWAGKVKRRVWGRVWNLQGDCIDTANNIYCFADPLHKLLSFDALRDKGAAAAQIDVLDAQATAADTFTALQNAVAPQGGGVACPSIACVKWWTAPAGTLTADVRGEIGTGYVETTAEIVARLVAIGPGTPMADGTVAAAAALRPAPVGWVAADESTTVATMIEDLLGSSSLLWLLNAAGQIELHPWEWGNSAISARSLSVKRTSAYAPVGTRKLGFRRNETKMARGDLAGIVLIEDVAFPDGQTLTDALADAASSADWDNVTGAGKPEDNATVGAPAGTNVAGVPAESMVSRMAILDSDVAQAQTDIADLINTYGSTETAAQSALDAQNAASAAQSYQTAAQTAQTAAQAASGAAQTAQGAAAASAQQASTSAGDAASSASSAAGSASSASSSATAAGQSATSAQGSATSAATSAGNASGSAGSASSSAGSAASSASSAEGSATSAASSANLAAYASGSAAARNIVRKGIFTDYSVGMWSTGGLGTVSVIRPADFGQTPPPIGDKVLIFQGGRDLHEGTALYGTSDGGWIGGDWGGRTIRITGHLSSQYSAFDGVLAVGQHDGQNVSFQFADPHVPAGQAGYTTVDSTFPITAGTIAIIPWVVCDGAPGSGGMEVRIGDFRIEDVTEQVAAGGYASAAAGSASSAAASADSAGQSASTSQSWAGQAQTNAGQAGTYAGQASTSAGQASTSASNAQGSANSAGSYAGQASTSAGQASGYASSASSSASSASSSASNAGNSATAAQSYANSAQGYAGNAQSSANAASGSASAASGSASSAAASASLSASYLSVSPNLIPNGSFENGKTGWNTDVTTYVDTGFGWGARLSRNGPLVTSNVERFLADTDPIPVSGSTQYTVTADIAVFADTGNAYAYVDVIYYASDMVTNVGDGANAIQHANADFSPDPLKRLNIAVTETSPSNAAWARVRIICNSAEGTISYVGARQIKLERNWRATAYSMEAGMVSTNAAIANEANTRASQDAALSQSISSLTASVSYNANLLTNPTGTTGLSGWTAAGAGNVQPTVGSYGEGPFFYTHSGNETSPSGLYQDIVYSGGAISLQASIFAGGLSGSGAQARFYVAFLDANKNLVGYSNVAANTAGNNWTIVKSENNTPPAGTAYLRALIDTWGPGSYTVTNVAWRRMKVETGAQCTNYTDDMTVQSVSASITTTQTAVATLQSQAASFEQRLSAGSPNFLKNGSGELGKQFWTDVSGSWGYTNSGAWGSYFACQGGNANVTVYMDSDLIAVFGNNQYSCTGNADVYAPSNDGGARIELLWYDSSNNLLRQDFGYSLGSPWFGNSLSNRQALALHVTSPANASFCRVRLVGFATQLSQAAWSQVKFEPGSVCTGYSQEATILTQQQVIQTTQSGVNSALARVALTLDVNGYTTGYEIDNNGTTGAMKFRTDLFEISSPSGGARTEYSDGNFRIYDSNGVLRVRMGVWS